MIGWIDGQQSAAQNLGMALKLRGFLVDIRQDHIYFSKGNDASELPLLMNICKNLGLEVGFMDRCMYVTKDSLSVEALEKIIWFPAKNHEAFDNANWRRWKYFVQRNHGPKVNTFCLETGVAALVKAMSAAGIATTMSCDGHGKSCPRIWFSSLANGIWFAIIFQEWLAKLELHYNWNIIKDREYLVFKAQRNFGQTWDLRLVLEDTFRMASVLLENATVLSRLKKDAYKHSVNRTKKMVKEMEYEQLREWMMERWECVKGKKPASL